MSAGTALRSWIATQGPHRVEIINVIRELIFVWFPTHHAQRAFSFPQGTGLLLGLTGR